MSWLIFDVQLTKDVGDLLHGGEARGDERKAELVLNHAHGVEHGLDTCGVAIHEEKLEELCELVVDGEG